ncbi:SMP-30/gluconolactonase/LRE family protein [Aurantiacibacter marinus]|uniref:SMP-30/Gluconolactonase/LRE-like region domain-containing protein n=1 Tax=Aurantiacibacter marinus TaxID=874156 RepID=A0A0H0XSI9_9SPHN|nr:SMP-30/gluconolactonase/LRE family protein [Aurantiacibacter marinus]KLI64956.1 hypothetical protein AAV99_05555 [Aurantiacibacter marinus]
MSIRKHIIAVVLLAGASACAQADTETAEAGAGDLPQWTLEDVSLFPADGSLLHAEDGVVLPDGRLLVGDAEHGLVTLAEDGTKTPFGNFAAAGFIVGPAAGWSNPNGVALEPDGIHVLVADIVEGKIFRANTQTGDVELVFDHEFGVNTAVADSSGAIWFTQSTRNGSGPDSQTRMWQAVDKVLNDGALYRLARDADDAWQASEVVGGLDFGNGVALDESRGVVYVAQTMANLVDIIPVDFASGNLNGARSTFNVFSPDNLEVDSDGNIWVAQPLTNQVSVINPDSGTVQPVFTPTPENTQNVEGEFLRRRAAGEPVTPMLNEDLYRPMPGILTGVILSPGGGTVYVSNLGNALVRLDR